MIGIRTSKATLKKYIGSFAHEVIKYATFKNSYRIETSYHKIRNKYHISAYNWSTMRLVNYGYIDSISLTSILKWCNDNIE